MSAFSLEPDVRKCQCRRECMEETKFLMATQPLNQPAHHVHCRNRVTGLVELKIKQCHDWSLGERLASFVIIHNASK